MSKDTKYDYIIYHNKCFDGFSGFYLFMRTGLYKKNYTVYPDVPSTSSVPPNIDGKNVISIDVSYKASIVKEIARRANKYLFIDHHKTNIDDIKKLKLKKPHKVVYKVTDCGASLVWKYFYGKKKMPQFLKYIKDNDLGIWKLENTLPFISYLEVNFPLKPNPFALSKWDSLMSPIYLKKIISRAKIYEEYKTHLIKLNARRHTIRNFPSKDFVVKGNQMLSKEGKYKVAVIGGGCPSVSLVGRYIMDNVDCDFCMIWAYKLESKEYVVSLRSKEVDIGEIAKSYGGGGHKLAAAFAFDGTKYRIDDLFSN